ncbi:hypothetical protein CVT26_006106, partial [Gymnopilus dilepis]
MHPAWKLLMRPPQNGVPPRVIAYVSTRLNSWRPAIRWDLVDHRDLLLLSLFSEGSITYLLNVYSDEEHTAIRFLADKQDDIPQLDYMGEGSITYLLNVYSDEEHTAIRFLADKQDDIPQLDYMGGDFNCHSSVWDGNVPHHRTTAISLLDSAASLGLDLALPLDPGPTHYPHDRRLRPSVIDLVFVHPGAALSSNVRRLTDLRGPSDHVPLGTLVPVGTASRTALPVKLPDDSVEQFLSDVSDAIKAIDVAVLAPTTPDQVEALAQAIASAFRGAWDTHAREVFHTNRTKPWWNAECRAAIAKYRETGSPADFNAFRKVCRKVKRAFFDARISEIATSNKRSWDLMNWIQQRKLPPADAITYNGRPCHDMGDLWDALHNTYNAASTRTHDVSCLDELEDTPVRDWVEFA